MTTLLIALALLAGGFLLLAFCDSLLFWYESLNSPDARLQTPRPGFVICVRVFLTCLVSFCLYALLFPFGPLAKRPPAPRREEGAPKPPLILIHGLYNDGSAWLWLSHKFTAEGHPVSVFLYATRNATPESAAEKLEAHIRQVEDIHGEQPLLIGHSLGGVIARCWLARDAGNASRLKGLITLGTPHHGSKLAVLGPGMMAATLIPGSPTLRALEAAPRPDLPCLALASPVDGLVLPPAALAPPEGWRLRLLPPCGHFSMLYNPAVLRILLEELRAFAPAPAKTGPLA